jgi:anti-sigma-K factor RskA
VTEHQDIEELLGAYALDAVDPDEARLVEEHLVECPRCRAEVAAHREVAALLTSGTSDPVPDGVWDRIAADLGDTPTPVPIEVAFGERRARKTTARTRPARVLAGLAAAAAVVVVALMGAVLVNQRTEIDDLRDEAAAPEADPVLDLLRDPTSQIVSLDHADGTTGARALVGGDGDSVLLASGLPDLGEGETYQLWGLPQGRESMVSLGVLGADPGQSEFHVEGGITTLAITREPGGGSTQPSSEPLVTGTLV